MFKYTILALLLPMTLYAECVEPPTTINLIDQCQMSYYKYAPQCVGGDGKCLSLYLHALMNKDVFLYRDDLRRKYVSPLKKKMFMATPEYKKAYNDLLEDYEGAKNAVFCSFMSPMWIYSLEYKAFSFPSDNLMSSSSVKLYTPLTPHIKTNEQKALEVEEWDTQSKTKMVFFKAHPSTHKGGLIPITYLGFYWTLADITFDEEGDVQVSYPETCSVLNGSGEGSFFFTP